MYVQIMPMDGREKFMITLSRLSQVLDLKEKIKDHLNLEPDKQRLVYKGKQLEDEYKLFDYNVKLNDVIQLMEKSAAASVIPDSTATPVSKPCDNSEADNESNDQLDAQNVAANAALAASYFVVDKEIDCCDAVYGAWFEAKIVDIVNPGDKLPGEDDYFYKVEYAVAKKRIVDKVTLKNIRPRAKKSLAFSDLKVDSTVMVNYNLEDSASTGYWYDLEIKALSKDEDKKGVLKGTLFVDRDRKEVEDVEVCFENGVMEIEKTPTVTNGTTEPGGPTALNCEWCRDNPRRKCKHCHCHVCGGKNEPELQIMCDECDDSYHIGCLDPPLAAVPDANDWYCPDCKNDESEIVKAGEKLKFSKRKAKMPSSNSKSSRDWGSGMATIGRSKECTIVGANHFGPVPGVDVGTSWKFRMQVSESGVHRPPVAGIHGRETEGAYSIVLSGGYEDDVDNGDHFMYTGSGGRDLSGNKRTAKQSCDQTLTAMNRALALNCDAKVDDKVGAEAKNWKQGKPIRVVRSYKAAKHSKFAPVEGNRYDGIYKVTKYYPEQGQAGFVVWRYALRRDDPNPPPWSKAGKKVIEQLGLEMQYPENYLAAQELKKQSKAKPEEGGKKRKATAEGTPPPKKGAIEGTPPPKKAKLCAFEPPAEVTALIAADVNAKLWEACRETLASGKPAFLAKVTECFMCICCQELVHDPITTACMHSVCKTCLQNSFAAEVYSCPNCRTELGKKYKLEVNATLAKILLALFPGYQVGR